MITFLKKKSQEQTESFIDLEERLAALQQVKHGFNLQGTRSEHLSCVFVG